MDRVFNKAKNDIGFDRSAVKTDATLEGKVFIVILAGMFSALIRNAMREQKRDPKSKVKCGYALQ